MLLRQRLLRGSHLYYDCDRARLGVGIGDVKHGLMLVGIKHLTDLSSEL